MKFLACILFSLSALMSSPVFAVLGDDRFLAAREAFRTGDRIRLEAQFDAARLAQSRGETGELDVWIEYWRLRQRIDEADAESITGFLDRQKDSWLAERLRADWLRARGRKQQWQAYVADYEKLRQPETDLQCYAMQAGSGGQRDSASPEKIRTLWLAVLDLPESCFPLVDRAMARGELTVDDVWMRLRRLLENKRYAAAERTAAWLPGTALPPLKTLEKIADKPQRYLDKQLPPRFAATRQGRELAMFALQRLTRNDPPAAADILKKISGKFPEGERSYIWGQIAWQAALRHQPEARAWYALADQGKNVLSDQQLAWQVRAALREHDWPGVQKAIEQMPAAQAAQPDWTYWRGRALAGQGRADEAGSLFQKIAGQPTFYGNLADEELGRAIVPPARPPAPTQEELASVRHNAGLLRALALFRLGMRFEGVREWNWALQGMTDRQLLAAANLAKSSEIFDRAIYTAERTREQHDYNLRYLAPFRDNVMPQTRQMSLDAGWVYGLMRQESRFVMNAQSGVGAKGLMQLMPKTAAWVAKKIGMTNFHPSDVTLMDTNVALGTHYLQMVLSDLDNHPVLASAAYNAGPGRARRWRADQPMEGAIYIETIPFEETRDYVKKVMSNAVYYSAQFNETPQSLKARLGVVGARGGAGGRIADLP